MSQYIKATNYNPVGAEDDVYGFIPQKVYGAARLVGATAGAYHGYKRNKSVWWALGWSMLGGAIPILSLPLSAAQGFGKPKK